MSANNSADRFDALEGSFRTFSGAECTESVKCPPYGWNPSLADFVAGEMSRQGINEPSAIEELVDLPREIVFERHRRVADSFQIATYGEIAFATAAKANFVPMK